MRRGRKAQPTVLHKLRHSYRSDRHSGRDPVAPGELVAVPAYLSEAQQRRFGEVLRDAPRGVLRRIDQAVLASYIIAESRMAAINLALQQQEQLLDTSLHGQVMIAALHKFQLRAQTSLERAAAQLGFSPTSRAGLKIVEERALPGDDHWDELARWDEIDRLQRTARHWQPGKETAAEKRRRGRQLARINKTLAKIDGKSAEVVDISAPTAAGPVATEPSKIIPETPPSDET
jgi:phage terminase small subunit